ncbi:type III-B CRISPR-associated protein Cas10/Cmr2 [Arcicella sp. DC2W]|uniref:Type III-B CRISPR-associated protein Cas10/Cmr2 n=1 Tax=Arcicella gelida TaxID=2984195 RepID=A0ABU5S3H4_9BACT|nr:type III-B CRISPR-associated protein Cas10/Cmr2 [Arcicella sp. DC2W]MEA5402996.1 type III-B CRISPR-associated protein Cas10/Cmr2 [Arcicella sp. DC2W]
MSNNKKHLFLFTIGPVQSFITQARKTQDLYAGSQILSILAQTGLKSLKNVQPIFPSKIDVESVPNRFLYIVETESPKKDGAFVEKKVRDEFYNISLGILNKYMKGYKFSNWDELCKLAPTDIFIQHFKQQIEQHLEIYWVFEEIKNDDYNTAYSNIQQQLASMKNIRRFQQFNQGAGEKGRKCSLDGERNALFFGEGTNSNYLNSKWNSFAITLESTKVAKNEGLSAVSFLKRMYDSQSFPSTIEIALKADIENISGESLKTLNEYKDIIFNPNKIVSLCLQNFTDINFNAKQPFITSFDTEYYYRENITEENFPNPYQRQMILEKFIPSFTHTLNTRHYALISFDGDSMGQWLSGEYLPQDISLLVFHQNISGYLIDFAKEATVIVNSSGKTIYAGGDDFLGFVNIQYLSSVLVSLQEAFKEKVNKPLNQSLSFSAGIVIAHYKTPLNDVLNQVRRLQGNAKKSFDDKNASGLAFMNRSSIIGETYCKNDDLCLLFDLAKAFKNKEISSTFLFKFVKNCKPIIGQLSDEFAFTAQVSMLKVELKRLIKRAKSPSVDWHNIEMSIYEPLVNTILLRGFNRKNLETSIDNFASFVKMAEKIAGELK